MYEFVRVDSVIPPVLTIGWVAAYAEALYTDRDFRAACAQAEEQDRSLNEIVQLLQQLARKEWSESELVARTVLVKHRLKVAKSLIDAFVVERELNEALLDLQQFDLRQVDSLTVYEARAAARWLITQPEFDEMWDWAQDVEYKDPNKVYQNYADGIADIEQGDVVPNSAGESRYVMSMLKCGITVLNRYRYANA